MCLDVSFHHGIYGLVFRSGVLDPPLRFLHEPVGPLLLSFRVSFLSQSGLQQQCMRGALAHQSIRSTERLGGCPVFAIANIRAAHRVMLMQSMEA
jgi:hypothetical protein